MHRPSEKRPVVHDVDSTVSKVNKKGLQNFQLQMFAPRRLITWPFDLAEVISLSLAIFYDKGAYKSFCTTDFNSLAWKVKQTSI